MKIREGITTMSSISDLNTSEATRGTKTNAAGVGRRATTASDQVSLSQEGIDRARYERALSAVMQAPDVDESKVADLKQAIADGTYNPPAKDVAQKMMDEWTFFAGLCESGGADHGEA